MPRERERESTMKSVFSHFQKIKPDGDRIVYLPTGVNWLVFGVFGGENSLLGKRECRHITLNTLVLVIRRTGSARGDRGGFSLRAKIDLHP